MKIFYSCLSKSWGGMEMITLTFIRKLLERNFRVELLCIEESRMQIEANNLGIIIHPVRASGYLHPFTTLKISSLIKKNNYDLIHTQASKDLWLLVPALKIAQSIIPLFLTKHMGSFIVKKDFMHRFLYERVTKAFAISTVIKNNLMDTTPLVPDKIELLYNGVDVEKFNPEIAKPESIRKEFKINENEIVIGMIARFSPGKGHEEFLESAKILSSKFSNLKFIVVGEASRGEDEYANSIKSLAEKFEIRNIIFAGFRIDTPDVLSAFDIFIFPSHAEAFGLALIEAMAMEKPSVCANADGVLDIAVDGKTNLLFQNKNADDLAAKTEQLIVDKNKRLLMGKAARERVLKNFDIEIITDKTIQFYNQSINEK
ncbi:MAG: glycosyltransferase family 4 protein [Ignavibacteriaceae bacterium]|nr:glycosyltransferase family 4 protein [Ignavibacterium sp.]MCC6254578.1 glycosyltransferase family 4 protein [Ignavibacteriaceae bacterium]